MNGYVPKPIERDRLFAEIQSALAPDRRAGAVQGAA
jgi:hypothetical protein